MINYYNSQNFNETYTDIKKKYWLEKGHNLKNIKKMNSDIKLKIRLSIHKKIIDDMKSIDINEKNKYYCNNKYLYHVYN